MSIILCKWIFLIKYETDNHSERFKVRLIVREFTQQFEVNYEDIFVLIIWFDFLKVLLALVIKFEWIIHMMNVQNVYLNSELDKEIYMKVLKRMNHLFNQICELLKSLYELKQSMNLWNKKIIKTLKSLKFEQIFADVSVFIYSCDIIVTLYIDNMLILNNNLKKVKWVKNKIKKLHVMKNLSSISKILEIHVTHQTDDFIKINQNHYIQQVLAEFDMKHAKQISV